MFEAIPIIFSQHSVEKGGNVLGFDRETENVVTLLFTLAVKSVDKEVVAQEQIRKFGKATMEYARSVDASVEWQYINCAYDFQDPLESYEAENIANIRAAIQKYDPLAVF